MCALVAANICCILAQSLTLNYILYKIGQQSIISSSFLGDIWLCLEYLPLHILMFYTFYIIVKCNSLISLRGAFYSMTAHCLYITQIIIYTTLILERKAKLYMSTFSRKFEVGITVTSCLDLYNWFFM